MNRALLTIELRHLSVPYGIAAVMFLAYALVYPKPLFWFNPGLLLIGLLQGALLGAWLFALPRRWEPYEQTLGASRQRIFWIRWSAGIGLQLLTVITAWLLLGGGLRMAMQGAQLPYYPMIRFFEANALWPALVVSLFSFQLLGFLFLRQKFHGRILHPVAGLILVLLFLGIVPGLFVTGQEEGFNIVPSSALTALYGVILFGSLLFSSRYCFRNMEIES